MVCADVSLEDLLAFHTPIDDLVFEKDATIYNMTDRASAVYCIRHGVVKLVRYDVSGNQRIVRFLKKNDVLGLDSVFSEEQHHTAIALTEAHLCRIPIVHFRQFIAEHPALQLRLFEKSQEALRDADNWLSHGRSYSEQRYSPLTAISTENIDTLGLAWSTPLESFRGIEATPLVVDGVMYTTGSWSVVFALDARTGEKIWKYEPQVPREKGVHACCEVVNRGVAVYEGKVYVGTLDGRLVALEANSGEELWSTRTFETKEPRTITGAPRVVKDKVIIGHGGAEYGVRGFVAAYDVDTGEQEWKFYTVPGNPADGFENDTMKMAAETWKGEWWKLGGGGTVCDSMAYDP